MIDFKLNPITWDENRNRTFGTIRVCRGAITTVSERQMTQMVPVTRYRRTEVVFERDFDLNGIYTKAQIVDRARTIVKSLISEQLIPEQA